MFYDIEQGGIINLWILPSSSLTSDFLVESFNDGVLFWESGLWAREECFDSGAVE